MRSRVRRMFIIVALLELLILLARSWYAHWHLWYVAILTVLLTYGLLELFGIFIERAQWTQVPASWQAHHTGERNSTTPGR